MIDMIDSNRLERHLLAAADIISHTAIMCNECPVYETCAKVEHTVLCKLLRDASAECTRARKRWEENNAKQKEID